MEEEGGGSFKPSSFKKEDDIIYRYIYIYAITSIARRLNVRRKKNTYIYMYIYMY